METESDVHLFNTLANREAAAQAQQPAAAGSQVSFADAIKASREASDVSAAPRAPSVSSVQWTPPAVPNLSPPMDPEMAFHAQRPTSAPPAPWDPQMTTEESEAEKHAVLLDLERLRQGGARLTREWSMRDSLDDMQVEARRLTSTVDEANAINTMKDMMRLGFAGVEFLNSRVPMLELDGWAESVSKDLGKYDSAMGKIYRKYWQRSNASSPEAEIMLGLGSSLVMHHAKNKFRKRAAARKSSVDRQPPPVPFAGRAKPAAQAPVPKIADDDSDDEMPPPGGNITEIKIE
jgi:hypothetical protein